MGETQSHRCSHAEAKILRRRASVSITFTLTQTPLYLSLYLVSAFPHRKGGGGVGEVVVGGRTGWNDRVRGVHRRLTVYYCLRPT